MSGSIKKRISHWLMMSAFFLAGASAGSFLGDPCRRLDGWSDIKSHQAMLTHTAGNQIGSEGQNRFSECLVPIWANGIPLSIDFKYSAFQADPNQRRPMDILGADYGEFRTLEIEEVPDRYFDLSVLIAQRHDLVEAPAGIEPAINGFAIHCLTILATEPHHYTSSRLKIAFVMRRLYIFQNQFNSIVLFSCLRDARNGTSVTQFGSISSPSPLVLSTYSRSTLVWAGESTQAQNRHCAADVYLVSAPAVRRSSHSPKRRMALMAAGETDCQGVCLETVGAGKTITAHWHSEAGIPVNGGSPKTT